MLEPTDGLKTFGYVHTYLNDPRGLAYNEVGNNTFNPGLANMEIGGAGFHGTACTPGAAHCNEVNFKRNHTSLNFRPLNESKQNEFNGTIEWKLGDAGTITAHGAYRKQKDHRRIDLEGTPRDAGTPNADTPINTPSVLTAFDSEQHNSRKTWVGQLDYNGQFGGLTLLSGFMYYDDKFFALGYADTGNNTTNPTIAFTDFRTKAWGAYIDGTYNINDKIFLTAGVRYNHDEKTLSGILHLCPKRY